MVRMKMHFGGSIDMLTGPLLKKILLFGLPLMASSVLQLLFNAADVVVLGRYANYASLAAVGGTTAIVNLVVNLLIGMAVGVNVVIARYIGEGDKQKEISDAIHTAVLMAIVGGLLLGGLGCAAAKWILQAVSTPPDIIDLALTYLYIYFAGTPAIMLYNYGAAALRARGDTQRPPAFPRRQRRGECGAEPAVRHLVPYGCGGRGAGHGHQRDPRRRAGAAVPHALAGCPALFLAPPPV